MSTADRMPAEELTARTKLLDQRMAAREKRVKGWIALAVAGCALFAGLGSVAALGSTRQKALDAKADAKDVDQLKQRVSSIEAYHEDEREWQKSTDRKLDWIVSHLMPAISGASPRRGR